MRTNKSVYRFTTSIPLSDFWTIKSEISLYARSLTIYLCIGHDIWEGQSLFPCFRRLHATAFVHAWQLPSQSRGPVDSSCIATVKRGGHENDAFPALTILRWFALQTNSVATLWQCIPFPLINLFFWPAAVTYFNPWADLHLLKYDGTAKGVKSQLYLIFVTKKSADMNWLEMHVLVRRTNP